MSIGALLFSFQGRISRKPLWLAATAMFLVTLIVGLILVFAGAPERIDGLGGVSLLLVILYIPLTWIALTVGAKRLHDRGKSAWWLCLFYFVPGILDALAEFAGVMAIVLTGASLALSIWAMIELGFLRGTPGPNAYGADPLAA